MEQVQVRVWSSHKEFEPQLDFGRAESRLASRRILLSLY